MKQDFSNLELILRWMIKYPLAIFLCSTFSIIFLVGLGHQTLELIYLNSSFEILSSIITFTSFGIFSKKTYQYIASQKEIPVMEIEVGWFTRNFYKWLHSFVDFNDYSFLLIVLPFIYAFVFSLNIGTHRDLAVAKARLCRTTSKPYDDDFCMKVKKTSFWNEK